MPNYLLSGQSWAAQPITWNFAASTLPRDAGVYPFSNAITRQDAQAVIATAFEAWSRAANLQFVYAPQDSASVDIRVGWGTFPVSTSSGREIGEADTRYRSDTNRLLPDTLIRLIDPSVVALSSSGGVPTYADGATLYQITLHEIGHTIGLAHDTLDPFAVMYPESSSQNRQLAPVDMQGAQAIYGVPQAEFIDIGANQETVSGTLSGAPTTVFGSSGALDYAGGNGLLVLGSGSARVHEGAVTVFAGNAALAAYDNQSGEFILGGGYSSIGGGAAGSQDIVFGGAGGFTYAGAQEAASVIGSVGSDTITGGAGGGFYSGGSDGGNSLTATGIGTVLVGGGSNDTLQGASSGYSYLVAGSGNETLIGAGGGTDRYFLGTGADLVKLGTSLGLLVTGTGTATIMGGGSSALFGGTGGADLYVPQAATSMDITGFRPAIDHVGGGTPASVAVTNGNTVLAFAGGATVTLNNVTDPSAAGLFA